MRHPVLNFNPLAYRLNYYFLFRKMLVTEFLLTIPTSSFKSKLPPPHELKYKESKVSSTLVYTYKTEKQEHGQNQGRK